MPKPTLKAIPFTRTVSFVFATITLETIQDGAKPPVVRATVSTAGRTATLQCPLLDMVEVVPVPGTREPRT